MSKCARVCLDLFVQPHKLAGKYTDASTQTRAHAHARKTHEAHVTAPERVNGVKLWGVVEGKDAVVESDSEHARAFVQHRNRDLIDGLGG